MQRRCRSAFALSAGLMAVLEVCMDSRVASANGSTANGLPISHGSRSPRPIQPQNTNAGEEYPRAQVEFESREWIGRAVQHFPNILCDLVLEMSPGLTTSRKNQIRDVLDVLLPVAYCAGCDSSKAQGLLARVRRAQKKAWLSAVEKKYYLEALQVLQQEVGQHIASSLARIPNVLHQISDAQTEDEIAGMVTMVAVVLTTIPVEQIGRAFLGLRKRRQHVINVLRFLAAQRARAFAFCKETLGRDYEGCPNDIPEDGSNEKQYERLAQGADAREEPKQMDDVAILAFCTEYCEIVTALRRLKKVVSDLGQDSHPHFVEFRGVSRAMANLLAWLCQDLKGGASGGRSASRDARSASSSRSASPDTRSASSSRSASPDTWSASPD